MYWVGWKVCLFGFFHKMIWRNQGELSGQFNKIEQIMCLIPCLVENRESSLGLCVCVCVYVCVYSLLHYGYNSENERENVTHQKQTETREGLLFPEGLRTVNSSASGMFLRSSGKDLKP